MPNRNRRHALNPFLSLLMLLSIGGCNDATESPDPQPAPILSPSSCAIPDLPDITGIATHTVGDGTPGSCTLPELQSALVSTGEIVFDCGDDPIVIEVNETLIASRTTVLRGAGLVTLDGGDNVRILRTDNQSTVVLDGLTFRGGHSGPSDEGGAAGSGGAVYRGWDSTLYVVDCRFEENVAEATEGFAGGAIGTASSGWTTIVQSTFTGNSAPYGGAVYSLLSNLEVVECDFENNTATDDSGGAIFTDGAYTFPDSEHGTAGGHISLCGSRFVNNSARASSGAGFLYGYGTDQLVIHRCEFSGNSVTSADPGLGGAIRIDAHAFISQSLFAENTTAGQGGALWMGRGPAVFTNVTFYKNNAALWGGAISCGNSEISLENCTVAYNTADEGADGFFCDDGQVTAHNTILAFNGITPNPNSHCNGSLKGDHNLAFPAQGDDRCGDDLLHVDPLLGEALEDLGGPTATLPISDESPSLSAGIACPAVDQRGEPRNESVCDLGAFELP